MRSRVRPPRRNHTEKPKLPEDFEARTWARLNAAVCAVHAKQPVDASFEELYRAVEDMCLHTFAPNLFSNLRTVCDAHVAHLLAQLRRHASPDPVVFLASLDKTWGDHCEQMLTVRSVFLYLDRTHVAHAGGGSGGARSLWDVGLALFRRHLDACGEVKSKTIRGLLLLVERERRGEVIDRPLMKRVVRALVSLGVYHEAFEHPFLQATDDFYTQESERFIAQGDVSDYLKHCESRCVSFTFHFHRHVTHF